MNIELQKISKSYNDKLIVKDMEYKFTQGLYLVEGKNGSGKSTLLEMIAAIDNKFDGSIEYNGYVLKDVKKIRSFVPVNPEIFPFIKGSDFLDIMCKIRQISKEKYIGRYNDAFCLEEILDLSFSEMSYGQKKKLFLCLNLIDECPVWILDEPFAGLDAKARDLVREAISKHSKKAIVIIAEHDSSIFSNLEYETLKLSKYK